MEFCYHRYRYLEINLNNNVIQAQLTVAILPGNIIRQKNNTNNKENVFLTKMIIRWHNNVCDTLLHPGQIDNEICFSMKSDILERFIWNSICSLQFESTFFYPMLKRRILFPIHYVLSFIIQYPPSECSWKH